MNHNYTLCAPEGNPGNKFAILIALIATIIAGAILAKSFKK